MTHLKTTFLSLFPESIRSVVDASILGRAVKANVLEIEEKNLRDYATNKHKTVDDSPCGGGPGQLIQVDVVANAIKDIKNNSPKAHVILTDPSGPIFKQKDAKYLAQKEHIVFVCGRYEGIDTRVLNYVDDVFSIGDFVLTGGELPALVMLDIVVRCVPGVLGNEWSAAFESHEDGLLEESQYTRPINFEEHKVPEVLLSGNHKAIDAYRQGERLLKTKLLRPDLFAKKQLSSKELKLIVDAEKNRPFPWEKA